MKEFVASSKKIQDEAMVACHSHRDTPPNLDLDGMVIDDASGDLDIDLEG